jgi:hypothetical protein
MDIHSELQRSGRWPNGCQTHRTCKTCKQNLPIENFKGTVLKKTGKFYHTHGACKACESIARKIKYRSGFRERLKTLMKNAEGRSRREDLPFDLDLEFIMALGERQEWKCFYSGEPMNFSGGTYSASIDRRDPHRGYTRDNVVLTLWVVNNIKRNLPEEVFRDLCKKIGGVK